MIFVALGTNLGDKASHIRYALARLNARGVFVLCCADCIETEPWGNLNQDTFLNTVAQVRFEGSPVELLEILLGIEKEMGRVRLEKWGPRLIDLDLIEFDGQQLQTDYLTLPHPLYLQRDFVRLPMTQIAPDFVPTGHCICLRDWLADPK